MPPENTRTNAMTRDQFAIRLEDNGWRRWAYSELLGYWADTDASPGAAAPGTCQLRLVRDRYLELDRLNERDTTSLLSARLDQANPYRQAVDVLCAVGALPAGLSTSGDQGWVAACLAVANRLDNQADAAEPENSDATAEAKVLRSAADMVRRIGGQPETTALLELAQWMRTAGTKSSSTTADDAAAVLEQVRETAERLRQPRRWALPEQPDPEVTELLQPSGRRRYRRDPNNPTWWHGYTSEDNYQEPLVVRCWADVLATGPVEDATPTKGDHP